MKLMTQEIKKALQAAAQHERPADQTPIVVKYFTPDAGCSWFITDGTQENDDWRLFGFCDIGDPQMAELGYVMLSELQAVRGGLRLPVERDLYFPETMLAEVLKRYGKNFS